MLLHSGFFFGIILLRRLVIHSTAEVNNAPPLSADTHLGKLDIRSAKCVERWPLHAVNGGTRTWYCKHPHPTP